MTVHDGGEATQPRTPLRAELIELMQRHHPSTPRGVLVNAATQALTVLLTRPAGAVTYVDTLGQPYVSVRISATYRAADDDSLPESLDVVWDNGYPPDGEALAGVIAALAQIPATRYLPPPGDPSLRLVAD